MKDPITIREAITESEVAAFWTALYTYFEHDIFPDPADGDRDYFFSFAYRTAVQTLHERERDRIRYLFFRRGGQDIGLAMPVVYASEDGKCFIMEFCVFPSFRGGTGARCAEVLLRWAAENSARYAELNCGGDARRERFWQRMGFERNGFDEWGEPLMHLQPEKFSSFFAEVPDQPCALQ